MAWAGCRRLQSAGQDSAPISCCVLFYFFPSFKLTCSKLQFNLKLRSLWGCIDEMCAWCWKHLKGSDYFNYCQSSYRPLYKLETILVPWISSLPSDRIRPGFSGYFFLDPGFFFLYFFLIYQWWTHGVHFPPKVEPPKLNANTNEALFLQTKSSCARKFAALKMSICIYIYIKFHFPTCF